MSKEIQQPAIQPPDLKDPFSWASVARVHCEWIRHIAPQLGLDTQKLVLGDVVSSIIGDDANVFTWIHGSFFDPELGAGAKRLLLERLDWEISTPETPAQIRGRLEKVRDAIRDLDWSIKDQFEAARDTWTPVKEWVNQEVNKKRDLRSAVDYDLAVGVQLSEHWNMFLYGRRNLF